MDIPKTSHADLAALAPPTCAKQSTTALSFATTGPYNRTTKKEFSRPEKIFLDVIPALLYDRVVEQHFSLFTLESQP